MGVINIPPSQQDALAAIDLEEIRRLIELAIRIERSGELRPRLANCGPYVANCLHNFEQDLARYREAKSAPKRSEALREAHSAGYELTGAVQGMKDRMERERKFAELFVVDDLIMPPFRFSEQMSIRVIYHWRRAVEDRWTDGAITFTHQVDPRPDFTTPQPKRKPSARQTEAARQLRLSRTWEDFRNNILYSLRDYFEDGGDGAKIPETYKATVDAYSRGLNNHSTKFWLQRP